MRLPVQGGEKRRKVERKRDVMTPTACRGGQGKGAPVCPVTMVTLDHSSPRPAAHLFSTQVCSCSSWAWELGQRKGHRGGQAPWGLGRRALGSEGQKEGEILEARATYSLGGQIPSLLSLSPL